MNDTIWYFEEAGQQVGPVDCNSVSEAIRSGRLVRGARVWRAGMVAWQPWESVPELAAGASPPPLRSPPPVGAQSGAPPFAPSSYASDVLTGTAGLRLYPKAPLGSRFVAAVIDNLVSSIPAIVLVVATIGAASAGATPLAVLLGLLAAAGVIWALWYAFTKDGRSGGQSIGKKAMGLMVVHLPTNKPCDHGQSALRYLVLFGLNLIPYLGWLVEPIVTLGAAGGRRLGDTAAGTQVIAASQYRSRG